MDIEKRRVVVKIKNFVNQNLLRVLVDWLKTDELYDFSLKNLVFKSTKSIKMERRKLKFYLNGQLQTHNFSLLNETFSRVSFYRNF